MSGQINPGDKEPDTADGGRGLCWVDNLLCRRRGAKHTRQDRMEGMSQFFRSTSALPRVAGYEQRLTLPFSCRLP